MRAVTKLCAVLFVIGVLAQTGRAQKQFPLWGDLQPGPYSVGYRLLYKYDYSRTFKPKYEYDGGLRSGERARPMEIRLWYPAKAPARPDYMPYRQYVEPQPAEGVMASLTRQLRDRNITLLKDILKDPSSQLDRLLNTPTAALRDATPMQGKFPVVVYSMGLAIGGDENVVLWEYLASHGYVVVASPSLGFRSIHMRFEPPNIETAVRDLEYLIAFAHELSYADRDKLTAAGFSYGGMAALLLAMRNSDVDAVVGLDPSFSWDLHQKTIKETPFFDPGSLTVPLLHIYNKSASTNLGIIDSLKYSDRYRVEFTSMGHVDFTSYTRANLSTLDQTHKQIPSLKVKVAAHDMLARYTLDFLNAHLGKDQAGVERLRKKIEPGSLPDDFFTLRHTDGMKAPPTRTELLDTISEKGFPKAEQILNEVRARDPEAHTLKEDAVEWVGNALFSEGDRANALKVFQLNTRLHPESARALYTLGEAYQEMGDKPNAINAFEKVLEMNPTDELKRGAEKNLKTLKEKQPGSVPL